MGACCACESDENKKAKEEEPTHPALAINSNHHRRDREEEYRQKRKDKKYYRRQRSRNAGNEERSSRRDKVSVSPVSAVGSSNDEKGSGKEMLIFVALFDRERLSPAELVLKKGDRLELLTEEPHNFVFARQAKTHGIRGYVPKEFLAREGSQMDEEFFYGELSRQEAINILSEPNVSAGTFLVYTETQSEKNEVSSLEQEEGKASPFTISVKDGSKPPALHHYRVRMTPSDRLYLKRASNVTFQCLAELLRYYHNDRSQGELACKLAQYKRRPVPANRVLPESMRDRWREIPRDELELTKLLGEGRFGEVRKAIWKLPNGQTRTVVAKQLKQLSVSDKKLLLDEASTMRDLRHENVVRLFGVVSATEPSYIVIEFVKDGALQEYLQNRAKFLKPPLTNKALIDICAQVARGMEHLISKRLVHRDLASRNILIDVKSDSPFSCVAKVADFGLARSLNKDYVYRMKHETYIAIKWLAPEAIKEGTFSPETDIWAFGITMGEIFCAGDDPWDDMDEADVKWRVMRGRGPFKPAMMPMPVFEIMSRCCQENPRRRPSFRQLASELEDMAKTF